MVVKGKSKIADRRRRARNERSDTCWKEIGQVRKFGQLFAEFNNEEFCFGRI